MDSSWKIPGLLEKLHKVALTYSIENIKALMNAKLTDKEVLTFIMEWRTVSLGTPRRTGKTQALKKFAQKKGRKVLIVSPNQRMRDVCFDGFSRAFSARESWTDMDGIDVVIVDEAAYVPNLKNIVKKCIPFARRELSGGKPFVLFFIGTPKVEGLYR
jgi:predicted AAA+ superfamily ATPase